MEEKEHIMNIFKKTQKAIRKKDVLSLKELSNQTIHSASTNQDEVSITIAVIIYSISKIVERTNYKKYLEYEKVLFLIEMRIKKALDYLKNDKEGNFLYELKRIIKDLKSIEGNFKKNIEDILIKAKINKASKIYEHGISMEKTAKLLGISLFELAEYIGNTGTQDVNLNITLPIKERIKLIEEIFESK
ncbi:MAG: hypothetical protein QW117_03370 [Candidatus Pacearchaeota archaeon]